MAYIHHPAANVSSISKLVKSNAGDPAQVLREVVSNASDAEARNITFVPLPYPIAHAGFIAIDDGTGMSRPVEGRKDPKGRAGDSNGRYPGLLAFLDIANSTREGATGAIGFMGIGSKLLWDADKCLMVVTKCAEDDSFAILKIDNPQHNIGPHNITYTNDVESVKAAVNGDAGMGLNIVIEDDRKHRFKTKVFLPWLEQTRKRGGHGTLIFVQGLTEANFAGLLENWDKAIGDNGDGSVPGFQRIPNTNRAQGDDEIELKTYLRFKTCAGNFLIRENLIRAGFEEEQIEQFERELSLNIPCLANAITVKYLTKGATNPIGKIVNQELFQDNRYSVKTLPQGYPYLCKAEHDGRDSRPSTITRWSNASFQDRFFDAFCHEGEPYTIILSVDGVWLRNQHFTMLDRSGAGGTRNPVLQSKVPTSVGDQSGVILSVKGVPVSILANLGFLGKLRRSLEKAEGSCPVFRELVARANNDVSETQTVVGRDSWEQKIEQVLRQERFTVECPVLNNDDITLDPVITKHHFISPSRGQEATVQSIYTVLTGALTKHHFANSRGIADLQRYWPTILHCNNAEGLDAIGLRRRDLLGNEIDFPRIHRGIPESIIENIEFKVHFHVSMEEGKEDYNHLFSLTDQIVCWDLSIGGMATPLPDVLPENITVSDELGWSGKIVYKYKETNGNEVQVPEGLKGYAFFIVDLRNSEGKLLSNVPNARSKFRVAGHEAVRVVALKQLITATFNNMHPEAERVSWHSAPPPPPPPSRRAAGDRGGAGGASRRRGGTGRGPAGRGGATRGTRGRGGAGRGGGRNDGGASGSGASGSASKSKRKRN